MLIQPRYLKLADLLNDRLFRVPPYQRAYSWESKQIQDLFADIRKIARTEDATHFLATMVGLVRKKRTIATDEFQEIEIVDGQQRLTTLITLLKAISLKLNRNDKKERAFANELDDLLVKGDDVSLVLLQTNHDTSQYFQTYLREGTHPDVDEAKTLADRLLLRAIVAAEEFVEDWEDRLLTLGGVLKNRLTVIFHEIEDERTVYTVFEVLNSRGLDVAWLDRLKSILMGAAFEAGLGQDAINELHQVWSDVYRSVGLHQGRSAEALRFVATLMSPEKLSKPLGEEESVEVLRHRIGRGAKNVVWLSNRILAVVRAVNSLHSDHRRAAVTKIVHARLLAVAIELRDDLSKAEKQELLQEWEKVTFRIFGMCRRDARTRVGEYVRLARSVYAKSLSKKEITEWIRKIGAREFRIELAVEQLRNVDCYEGWEERLRYFMYRYEEHLVERAGQKFESAEWNRIWAASPQQSIEHIQPRARGSEVPTESKERIFAHRLGNLTLLPVRLNSKLQHILPSKKADAYATTGLLVASSLVPALASWTPAAVIKREEELLTWARDEWG